MNMFARFDKNPAMTRDIKKKKNVTDGRENSIPTTEFAGGIIMPLDSKMALPRGSSILHRLI